MSLSCVCYEWDMEPGSWMYHPPQDFSTFQAKKRKRCVSCNVLIEIWADCLKFDRTRSPYTEVEERIMGDEILISPLFMCETCGEIYLNLQDIGYCLNLGDDMRSCLKEYHELTGFVPVDS